ncbi:MAG: formylglycine-generating enzyme family protein, partial [Desulfobulbaceae bacterium]|nr:formylglycine-generating enzyme family protein [Desulfobulbaceae bacterium]
RKSGRKFRLPSEAEWEYAARGGTKTIRYWGDAVDSSACRYANVADQKYWKSSFPCDDSYQFAAPVGKFRKNNFGLYDMLGNVWEWCHDWYGEDYYSIRPRNNPQGPSSGSGRVIRGGGWSSDARVVRSADRGRITPDSRGSSLGFRLVLPPGQ